MLLSGPRQVGKTAVAQRLIAESSGAYFDWDVAAHRKALREDELPANAPLWVFDEPVRLVPAAKFLAQLP